jgi:HPt (histidine-containing phosphotransfer) domain-containing protein
VEDEDPEQVLREVRERFVRGFSGRCDRLDAMIAQNAFAPLVADTHQLAGLAGMIGLPSVSERARELEDQLRDTGRLDAVAARHHLSALRHAMTIDLQRAASGAGGEEDGA